jgi:hypothetical protein
MSAAIRFNERKHLTMFKVPNTKKGREFLKQLRRYATKGTRIKARGRGPRVEAAQFAGTDVASFRQCLPLRYAAYFGIYISKSEFQIVDNGELRRLRTIAWSLERMNSARPVVL